MAGYGWNACLRAKVTAPSPTPAPTPSGSIHIDANPFLFVYKGVTCDLPEVLTNIGPEGLDLVIVVWSTVEGEWVSFHPHTGAGFLRELVNGRPYVMPVTEDGVCNDWYWPSD